MAYVTVHTLDGDSSELLSRKEKHFDPIVRRIAPEYGCIASVTIQTETGLMIVNAWESADRVPAFTAHPEVQAANSTAQLPRPSSFQRYEQASIDLFQP